MIWYWHTKNSNERELPKKPIDERDSYERVDNYNTIGMAVYYLFKLNGTLEF